MVTCRTYTIEKAPTPGFTLTADQYDGIGSFNTTLHISYPVGAGQIIRIVNSDPISGDSCLTTDIPLDGNGNATVAYSVTGTHTIYVIKTVGTGGENCCTSFSQTLCQYSNYITFTVTPPPDIGNIQFLSSPSGAQIWLAPTGQTPVYQNKITTDTVSNLLVGNYDYILKLANYNDYISVQPIMVIKDQRAIVGPINLVPAEGCIYFTSSPSGARIFLGATLETVVDTGFTTPKLICELSIEQHCYKLVLAEYEDKTGCITLGPGQGQIITETLRRSPVLADITIFPLNPTVTVGMTKAFSATPLDQFGEPFPATVTWNNSNSFVGNIDPSTGIFTALHVGTSIITASSGNVNKSTTVTVIQVVPVLTTITVSPSTLSIQAGNAAIFTVQTLDQYNNPISVTITWNSGDENVGTIAQNGIFTAISPGVTIIMAYIGNISGIAIVNVTPAPVITPVLTTITVLPNTASIVAGNSTVFTVVTLDQYGNPIFATVTWSSSDTNVGTIGQNGVFAAISHGTTIIRATSDTISGLAIVNVTPSPVLDKIIISPSTLSISTNNSAIFAATTLDQFGNPISATVTWNSSDENVGTIQQNGVFAAISPGATTITATSEEAISGIAIANVTQLPIILPVLTRIEITPLTTTLTAGSNAVFLASTLDQFGNPISVTMTWNSSDTNIGTITQNGVFTAISPGTTTIMASGGNISGVALANVIPVVPTEQPTLVKIVITPSTETVLVGTGTVFVASTLDQFGNSIVAPVTWDSSNINVGTIDQNGVFTAMFPGITTIIATNEDETISGIALVNVVKTLPGQAAGGVFGNINNAALILGMAMVGAVIMAKPPQPPEIRIIERSRT